MLKNFLIVVAALIFCTTQTLQAQDFDPNDEPKNELALAYGAINSSNCLDVFSEVVGAMFGARYKNSKFVGPFSAEYFYHVTPLIGVGGIGVYNHHKEDVVQGEQITGKRTSNYFTIMPAVKFNWLRKQNWGLYSKLGAGYTHGNYTTTGKDSEGIYIKDSSCNDFFNFQVSLIGAEAGNRNVRGFAELGFGEQGLIHGGVRFRF